jgi:hypothetical protein
MTRRSSFKKTDLTRATRAVLAAGLGVARVNINKDGSFAIIPETAAQSEPAAANENPWDEVLTNAAHEKRPS